MQDYCVKWYQVHRSRRQSLRHAHHLCILAFSYSLCLTEFKLLVFLCIFLALVAWCSEDSVTASRVQGGPCNNNSNRSTDSTSRFHRFHNEKRKHIGRRSIPQLSGIILYAPDLGREKTKHIGKRR